MKHMLPSADLFCASVSKMGIENSDLVVIYDRHGTRTAPRSWWMFRMFGHDKVAVLDGGLPAWITAGHPVSDQVSKPTQASHYQARPPLSGVISQADLLALLPTAPQIVDARSSGRFRGTAPEPRAGLRSGRIPNSISLPFGNLRTEAGHFKPLKDLANMVGAAGIDLNKPIITTCGSGVTAAGLTLTLHRLGAKDISVYDGSWTEWGASDAPIEVG